MLASFIHSARCAGKKLDANAMSGMTSAFRGHPQAMAEFRSAMAARGYQFVPEGDEDGEDDEDDEDEGESEGDGDEDENDDADL